MHLVYDFTISQADFEKHIKYVRTDYDMIGRYREDLYAHLFRVIKAGLDFPVSQNSLPDISFKSEIMILDESQIKTLKDTFREIVDSESKESRKEFIDKLWEILRANPPEVKALFVNIP